MGEQDRKGQEISSVQEYLYETTSIKVEKNRRTYFHDYGQWLEIYILNEKDLLMLNFPSYIIEDYNILMGNSRASQEMVADVAPLSKPIETPLS